MTFIMKISTEEIDEKKVIRSERTSDDIAWVFPEAIVDWENKLKMSKLNQLLVKNAESALIYEHEQYTQKLMNGIYKIDRKEGAKNLRIVFLEKSAFDIKWGIPRQQGSLTSDNVRIGSSGTITVTISSAETMCNFFLKDSSILTLKSVKSKINTVIKETMREVISQYSIEGLQKVGRGELIMMVIPLLVDSLMQFGILAESFSLTGLGIPPEFQLVDSYLEQSIGKTVEIDSRYELLLIVEGITELRVLPVIFDKFSKDKLTNWRDKIWILPLAGTGNIKQALRCSGFSFERIAKNTLVVIDSDKKEINKKLSDQNRELISEFESMGWEYYILNKKEIENYIHPAAMGRFFQSFKWDTNKDLYDELEDVKKIIHNEAYKSGLKANSETKQNLFEIMTLQEFDIIQTVKNLDGKEYKEFDNFIDKIVEKLGVIDE